MQVSYKTNFILNMVPVEKSYLPGTSRLAGSCIKFKYYSSL